VLEIWLYGQIFGEDTKILEHTAKNAFPAPLLRFMYLVSAFNLLRLESMGEDLEAGMYAIY